MRIGYPCVNESIDCTASSTFRLRSFSRTRFYRAVESNLSCLENMLRFNIEHGLGFLRIGSGLIPFASHPVCRADWRRRFAKELSRLGRLIRSKGVRVSMHPDQFTVLNALEEDVVRRSVFELEYHAQLLDAMGLDAKAKIQIHIGGVYDDKEAAKRRFVERYRKLSKAVRRRLVIENDDRLYTLSDCLEISKETGVPVLLDAFHHALLNNGESMTHAMLLARWTWKKADGPPMMDYSSQQPGLRAGAHADTLNPRHFKMFLSKVDNPDFDLMLEIRDKEKSALRAIELLREAERAGALGRLART